jgi:formyltetrahydrofolate deformylase
MKDSAVLLIDCPDRKGLIARVSSLLYERGANILHADQHQDHELGLFFMRVEWSLAGPGESQNGQQQGEAAQKSSRPGFDLAAFRAAFTPLAAELGMRWQLTSTARLPRVALFCSQYLHCAADLLYRWRSGELLCDIPLIVSNHRDVEPLAAFYGIPFEYIPIPKPVTPGVPIDRSSSVGSASTVSINRSSSMGWSIRPQAEARQLDLLADHQVDLVVLARYMQILSPAFVARYPAAIINVHHSFLPAFTGARPYHAAHARGVKLIGATSHYVTELLDDGPIIEQDVARISHRDQVEDLVARGRDLERIVLSRAVRWHLDRRILCYGNKTVVFD